MIRDHMTKADDIEVQRLKPRPGFLVAALFFILAAVLVYAFEKQIVGSGSGEKIRSTVVMQEVEGIGTRAARKDVVVPASEGGEMIYALLLIMTVLCAGFCVLCYRNPQMGSRLLGYSAVDEVKQKTTGPSSFSTGFHFDSASTQKKINTARREGRAARRKYARKTREMQSSPANNTDDKD